MQNDLIAIQDKLASVKDLLIIVAKDPSLDVMAAALSLYLSLEATGKNVKVLCESASTVRDSHLVGIDKVKQNLGGGDLVLTVNVEGDVVDKVTSAVEGGKLSLTIIPKSGHPAFSAKDIVFNNTAITSDLIFAVGGSSQADFGPVNTPTLVNISNLQSSFGQINLVDSESSLCELVTALVQELRLPLTDDIASNLMQGIEAATNNLQSEGMTADTFEALAILYRAGARHRVQPIFQQATIIDNTPIIEERQNEDRADIAAVEAELHSMTKPEEDWLKPKIFNSSSDK
jgi:hypothetical protein